MDIQKSEAFTPNTWRHWIDRDFAQKTDIQTAVLTCPNCGNAMSLKEHTIAENGAVSPSVVCPEKDCTFHEFVVLKEWTTL